MKKNFIDMDRSCTPSCEMYMREFFLWKTACYDEACFVLFSYSATMHKSKLHGIFKVDYFQRFLLREKNMANTSKTERYCQNLG